MADQQRQQHRPKRKYKNYLEPDNTNARIPRTTKWRKRKSLHVQVDLECLAQQQEGQESDQDPVQQHDPGAGHAQLQHANMTEDEADGTVNRTNNSNKAREEHFSDSSTGSSILEAEVPVHLNEIQSLDSSCRSGQGEAETPWDNEHDIVLSDVSVGTNHQADDSHYSGVDEPATVIHDRDLPGYSSFPEDSDGEYHDAESWDQNEELTDEEQREEDDIHEDGERCNIGDDEDDYDEEHFNFNESLNEPLVTGSNISKAEALIMVLSFVMRHCLSASAVSHLFELLNILLGTYIFRSTKCILRQIFCNNIIQLTFHFYCTVCYSFVQSYDALSEDNVLCPHCTEPCMVKDLKHGNFFVTSNLKLQVRALFERNDISPHLSYRSTRHKASPNNIEDIYDGKYYKKMMEDGEPLSDSNNFSYTFNSDGLPVFKSSKYTLWPIYIMINELPPRLRTQNLLLAGVWFGKCEPKMEIFLEKFTHEANKLSEEGVFWKQGDELKHSRLFGICCCADAPARSSMQNRIRFNGYYGCGLCYHPGKAIDRVVKYPIDVCDYNDRNDEEMLQDMNQSLEDGRTVRGVKGPSPLVNLSYFPICWGFPPDYMHCLLLGVMRQLAELWFASRATCDYYIGSRNIILAIDQRIKSIKPPSIVARAPRPISERNYWKASEWYMWLLFYSVPCLKGILPSLYLNHLILLVEATFILLQKSLSMDELEKSDILLISFVCRFQILYGAGAMTYNVHCLTHLAKCVSLWGPMWTHSCFAFEAANYQVKRQLHGNQGIILQVVRKFLLLQTLPLYIEHPRLSPHVKYFCEKMFNKRGKRVMLDEVIGDVSLLGCGKAKLCTQDECDALAAFGYRIGANTPVLTYSRFSKSGMLFCTEGYRAGMTARSNELVLLSDNKLGKLIKILLLENSCIILVKYMIMNEVPSFIDEESDTNLGHIRECVGLEQNVTAMDANEVAGNCIAMNIREILYIGMFPNYVAVN